MKNIVLSICIMSFSASLPAQTEQLIVKGGSKSNYVEHKVTAKENFYSIGRLFNVHPKHLALFNSLDMSKGLSIGQTIKIPLSDTNYNHKSEFGTPVYYVTGTGETVYNVSTNNNVLMEKLRKWNKITGDKLSPGSKLIVGFVVNNQQQGLAVANPQKEIATDKRLPDSTRSSTAKNESPVSSEPKKEDVKQIEPGPAKKEVVKEDSPKNDQAIDTKKDVSAIEPGPAKKEVVKEDLPKNESAGPKPELRAQNANQGYFKTSFDQQIKQQPITKEQTLTSGIFKTASGWSDAKYYLLMDGVEPGTIVKITNPANNKMIYAKLLGEMSGLKANQGVNIRISNAAASALDVAETDKFIVKLNY
jgi:LysM repeat protein